VGSKKFLNQVLDLGFYIGITGLITYDQGLQEVIKTAPYDRILIETDAPYLMPEPIRQTKRWPNAPKHVTIVAEKVAELLGDSFVSVTQQTTANAQKLFRLP
jgi:TatD DNase family protein